ncbi:MAG: MOSC domain-containing protein [Chloroflexi bacterium]|nr:MOSC domain-containing protein [Chloroflexota bacterium]
MFRGSVVAIFITPEAGKPMVSVNQVRAVPGKGLDGDRYFKQAGTYSDRPEPGRQVTLVEEETLEALKRDLKTELRLGDSRRNIVTRGVPLNHLVGREFHVGRVRLRGTRLCEPCTYLESLTQAGVKGALEHRGGLRAEILADGVISVGDTVQER